MTSTFFTIRVTRQYSFCLTASFALRQRRCKELPLGCNLVQQRGCLTLSDLRTQNAGLPTHWFSYAYEEIGRGWRSRHWHANCFTPRLVGVNCDRQIAFFQKFIYFFL
jgi:hypothetical protein